MQALAVTACGASPAVVDVPTPLLKAADALGNFGTGKLGKIVVTP